MINRLLPYYKYLATVKFKFLIGLFFGILYSISSGLGLPLMAETVFPVLFNNTEQAPKWLLNFAEIFFDGELGDRFLIFCCLLMPAVIFVRSMGAIGNGYYMTYCGIHVVQAIQTDMFKKVQSLPLAFLSQYKTGELSAAVFGHPQRIKGVIVDTTNQLIKEPLTLISALGFLIYKSFTSQSFFIAIIGIISMPLIILVIKRIGIYLAKRSVELVKMGEKLSSWGIECFQSPIEIRAYNLQKKLVKEFKEQLNSILRITMKSTRFSLFMSPSIELISGIGISLALFLGASSGMKEGEFLSLVIALYMAYTPVKKIGGIQNAIKILEAPLDRLEAVLFAKDSIKCPANPKSFPNPIKHSIKFENIYFEYDKGKNVLENINILIPAEQSIGIVGKSGSGKSSLVNLILRLYDPLSGKITIDGIDIREFDPEELRNHISYVPQTPLLYNASILDNIRLGRPDATKEEIMKSAKLAQAHEFIEKDSLGYDRIVGEKGNLLSGGQKQKISIARAFLKNAPILILDEATSSLDNEADDEIKKAIYELSKNRTTISIAHRPNSLELIENRVFMINGIVHKSGKHEDLFENCPEYKNLTSS
jgi:subfamily B ATP-binding cassette protein MsbA